MLGYELLHVTSLVDGGKTHGLSPLHMCVQWKEKYYV